MRQTLGIAVLGGMTRGETFFWHLSRPPIFYYLIGKAAWLVGEKQKRSNPPHRRLPPDPEADSHPEGAGGTTTNTEITQCSGVRLRYRAAQQAS